MEAYLDNAATTQVYDEVCQVMVEAMRKYFGNPSSLHMKGVEAEHYIRDAKAVFARLLKVNEKEIFFTSGGTESNNMALIGAAMANQRRGKHIITTQIEHPSVYNPLIYLESQGFEVTYLPVDHRGIVSLEALHDALRKDTILVSVMCVNNEIGTVQPLDQIGQMIKDFDSEIVFHVDAIQGFGKMQIYPARLKIDMISISGHKLHGPKGIGVLYIRDKVKVRPLILGGGQQKDMRSGTENVPGIAGIAKAATLTYEQLEQKVNRLYEVRRDFVSKLKMIDDVHINGFEEPEGLGFSSGCAPHVVSASFGGIRAEVLLHALEDKGVYVSSGSACASNHPSVSGTLKSIGVDKKYLDATVRFSFSLETTQAQTDYCFECLQQLVPMLRRFTRR